MSSVAASERRLTREFADFAWKNAQKIFEELNNSKGPVPEEPDIFIPCLNEDGPGKKELLLRYFIDTGRSPFQGDDDKSQIREFSGRILMVDKKAC